MLLFHHRRSPCPLSYILASHEQFPACLQSQHLTVTQSVHCNVYEQIIQSQAYHAHVYPLNSMPLLQILQYSQHLKAHYNLKYKHKTPAISSLCGETAAVHLFLLNSTLKLSKSEVPKSDSTLMEYTYAAVNTG